jgi:DNA-binding beta-propeller fold protein YncE
MRDTLPIAMAAVIAGLALQLGCSAPPATQAATSPAATTPAPAREKGGQEEFGPYELVEDWPQPLPDGPDGVKHDGWTWGSVGAVYAETPDRIWIAQRGELPLPPGASPWTPYAMLNPSRGNATGNTDGLNATCQAVAKRGWERRWHHSVFVVDRAGKIVQDWPHLDKMFPETACGRGPHKIKMSPYDPEKHVWIFDDQQHVIWKFTYDGKLVMTLGTVGQRGRDGGKLFDRPTDIAWLPDGTFFISDGYGGTRVAKFDKDGTFLMDWGTAPKDPKNPGPNEFNTVHSIQISDDGRLFVVDRGHRRMQVFDQSGKFLDMWSTGLRSSPYAHLITTDQHLWISDGGTNRILKYDLDGHFLYGWGAPGGLPGQFDGPHSITTDQEGNLYLAEVFNGRVQKFRPKPGADPAKVVGQEKRYEAGRSTN